MTEKVGMVHSVASLVPVFNELASELLPGVEVIHLVDEGLLRDILASGQLTTHMARRFSLLASFAEESGAKIVMLTYSSLAPLVDEVKDTVKVPLLRVDEAMADEAVKLGERVGVIATAHTALRPTSDLVKVRSTLQGKKVAVETVLCEGAFDALHRGDLDTHDKMVKDELNDLMGRVDVVVLAQASIARVVAQIPEEERSVPILSSPRLGVQRLKEKLGSLTK
jgi:Asp/Glu/hydantoin racemase